MLFGLGKAEAYSERSIAVARQQQAKSWEPATAIRILRVEN
jgi:hypothetical protein